MSRKQGREGQNACGRRSFLKRVVAVGAGMTLFGALPAMAQEGAPPEIAPPVALKFGGDVQLGRSVPVIAKCDMLEVSGIEFLAQNAHLRANVRYQFRDGKTRGAAAFRLQLLSSDNEVLADQVLVEKRIRAIEREVISGVELGEDGPNRSGKVKFTFPNVPMRRVAEFVLEISPVQ